MENLKIEIKTTNEAFRHVDPRVEVDRILHEAMKKLDQIYCSKHGSRKLIDFNGNTVGKIQVNYK